MKIRNKGCKYKKSEKYYKKCQTKRIPNPDIRRMYTKIT